METISQRITHVVESEKLTKTAFANSINISQPYLSQICSGQREPSDRTVSDICRVYGINEPWLREGVGEMYVPKTREETIAEIVGSALNGSNDFKKAVIQMICSRTDQELETLEAALRSIYESL